jgi:small subunit ribosomal protein S20
MANIKSQIKRNRQNVRLRERNKAARSALKTQVKRVRQAAEEGDAERTSEAYRNAARALDKAASKGIIHKNNAANKKSKLARLLKSE